MSSAPPSYNNNNSDRGGRGGGRGFAGRGGGRGGYNNSNNSTNAGGYEGRGNSNYHTNNNNQHQQGGRGGAGAGPSRHTHNANANAFDPNNIPVDYAFDSLGELYQRSRAVLGGTSSVVFPTTLAWYRLIHCNEKGDYSQLPLVWANCHEPWTFERMKRIKDEETARAAGVASGSAAAANGGASSISQRERSEYGMSTANTSYSGGIGHGGHQHNTYGGGAAAIQKEQSEQLNKYLQAMTREHPILRLCADVVIGGKVDAFMAPMCSPLTKASCRYLTMGREGAGVEATDDERVSLAKSLRRHGLLPGDAQPIYRSSIADHMPQSDEQGGGGGGGGGDDDDDEGALGEDDIMMGNANGPRKYWITEKSDGLRVVLCSQMAPNFPRWTMKPTPAAAAAAGVDNAASATTTPSTWLSHLQAPPLYPSQCTPIGASLQDTVVLESARTSVSAVWTRVVNTLVRTVMNHAQKTMVDEEERSKLLDNATIGFAVLAAVSTALAEALGEASSPSSSSVDEEATDSLTLPFELPTMDLIYNGVRNIANVVSADIEGGLTNTMLFAESDQIRFATSGAFVLRIPIPLGFLLKHLERCLKEAFKAKLAVYDHARLVAAGAADVGSSVPPPPLAAPATRTQGLTPTFILVQKTARGDGGAIIMNRQLSARHFTYLFDRSMAHVYCMAEEYPFRLNTAIMDAELIVSIPPVAMAPTQPSELVPTLHVVKPPVTTPPTPAIPRKAFFAIFDLFAYTKELRSHPVTRSHELTLLNRATMKERWDALEQEVVGPMAATAGMLQRHMVEAYQRTVAEANAKAAAAAVDGAAVVPPVLPSPPVMSTITMFRKEMWPLEALPACLAHIRKTRMLIGTRKVLVSSSSSAADNEPVQEEVEEPVYEDYYLFRGKTLNDGLIFTPDDFNIIAGSRKQQLKWKWPDKLSVDWKIAPLPNKVMNWSNLIDSETGKLIEDTPENQLRVQKLKAIEAWEFYKVDMFFRRKKKPVDLAGDSEYRRSMRMLNPKHIHIPQMGCVAECSFNAKEKLWQIEKVRKDKFESNAVITIISVTASACEGLDMTSLLATLGFLSSERASMLVDQYLRLTAGAVAPMASVKASLQAGEKQHSVVTAAAASSQQQPQLNRNGEVMSAEEMAEIEAQNAAMDDAVKAIDASIARRKVVEAAVLPDLVKVIANKAAGLPSGDAEDGEDDQPVNPEDIDEEEKAQINARKQMIGLSEQLPMVKLIRQEKAAINAKEAAAIEAAAAAAATPNGAVTATSTAAAKPTNADDDALEMHDLDDGHTTTNGASAASQGQLLVKRAPSYMASIPRCYMAVTLSSRAGGGKDNKALFLQWHAKIAVQRNSIPCNQVMVKDCYGLGEECPSLHSGSRLEGLITMALANSGGCHAWTDMIAEVAFDPLTGRWGIASIEPNGNKNLCYGTQVISHLEAVAAAQLQGKKFVVPKTLRNLTARPPLGVAKPIDALNPTAHTDGDGDAEEEDASAAIHDDDVTTSSAVNAAHYALRTVELRDNDETSRVRRFNNWVKSVLIANATALVRSELHKHDEANGEGAYDTSNATKKLSKAAAIAAANDSALLVANTANAPIAVAEMCCGRGGDLQKWRNQISGGYLLMVDHCFEAVAEAARRYSTGKGLSTKVAEGKDGYPGIPAHFAVKSCFSDEIMPIVEHCKATAPKPQLVRSGFHIVSCQFSMHYAFQTEQQVRNFLFNVSSTLRVGGLFVGTTCDATEILARKARHGASFGNNHYNISFNVSDREIVASVDAAKRAGGAESSSASPAKPTVATCYGTPYRFSLETSVVGEVEYLVDWERFTEMANRDYGLVCIESHNFRAFRDHHRRTPKGGKLWEDFLGDEALRKKGLKTARSDAAAATGDAATDARLAGSCIAVDNVLTAEEDDAVSLYRTFVFQKLK